YHQARRLTLSPCPLSQWAAEDRHTRLGSRPMTTELTREERIAQEVAEIERSIAAKEATRAALDAEFPNWCRVIGGWSNQTQYECELDGETLLGDAYASEGNADELAMARLLKACRMHVERRVALAKTAENDAFCAAV